MKKINLGIIGDGYHFKKNIEPVLKKLNKQIDLKIFIIKKKNKEYNYTEFFRERIDICYLATPSKTHYKLSKICIENDVSVISEKPLCETLHQAKTLILMAKNKNVFISEAFMYIYHPIFKYLKKLITNKKLEILYAKSELTIPSLNKKNNRYNLKKGGGFYNDLAIYPLSLEYHLFNSKKLFKINKLIYSDKKMPLRGYINFKSNSFERFYFWGEGQKYCNNLSIIFKSLSVHVDNFYSKNPKYLSCIEINGKKNTKIFFPKCNHFYEMFLDLLLNYKNKKFVLKHRKNIINLSKIKNQL